jgi:hypothetical protein
LFGILLGFAIIGFLFASTDFQDSVSHDSVYALHWPACTAKSLRTVVQKDLQHKQPLLHGLYKQRAFSVDMLERLISSL